MILCRTCLMPNTRPRIVFEDGVCNACSWHFGEKTQIDWTEREGMFRKLVASKKKHPFYDMIVPFSGGKDSASIAMKLKGMGYNPLLVTYGQLMWTDVGRHNFDLIINQGFDCDYWRVNQRVSKILARRFLIERGHPKLHYDAGVNVVPVRTAIEKDIPLVIFAEHGETEYGGLVLSDEHRRRRDLAEVLENQVGDDARNWVGDGIEERDLYPYIYPDDVGDVEAVYFSWYFKWDIYRNACEMKELGFKQARHGLSTGEVWWGRSDGSFEGFDSIDDKIDDLDYYLMSVKYGFGRSVRMASRLIQYGHMTREEGVRVCNLFDGDFPKTYLPDVLEYLGMTPKELRECIEEHRNPEGKLTCEP